MLTDGRTDDGRTTDAGVIGILIAHLGAFGSGELKMRRFHPVTKPILLHAVVVLHYTHHIKMACLVKGGRLSKCSKTIFINAH